MIVAPNESADDTKIGHVARRVDESPVAFQEACEATLQLAMHGAAPGQQGRSSTTDAIAPYPFARGFTDRRMRAQTKIIVTREIQ